MWRLAPILVVCAPVIVPGMWSGDTLRADVNESQPVPAAIIRKADEFVVSRVGAEFFARYMSLHSCSVELASADLDTILARQADAGDIRAAAGYQFSYDLIIPERPVPAGHVWFKMDLEGNVDRETLNGLPDCVSCPEECEFPIDEDIAREIAVLAGLEPGIKEWRVSLIWHCGFETYLWSVENLICRELFGGWGESVSIDANDGRILSVNEYRFSASPAPSPRRDRRADSVEEPKLR